jgi:hypothetical protein
MCNERNFPFEPVSLEADLSVTSINMLVMRFSQRHMIVSAEECWPAGHVPVCTQPLNVRLSAVSSCTLFPVGQLFSLLLRTDFTNVKM